MTLVPNPLLPSSGNKSQVFSPVRPIYLISKTSHDNAVGVIHIPILSINFLTPAIDFSRYDGLIVTSKEGARALEVYMIDWKRLDILCVGEATARAISAMGGCNITIAAGYGDSLLEILENHTARWLYLRPKAIASSWPKQARAMGKKIDEVIVYETSCNGDCERIEIERDGVLIFTSPSGIECFLKRYEFSKDQTIVTIGLTTQKALPAGIQSVVSPQATIASTIETAKKLAL